MVTMTSESDKASSSASKKTNSTTAIVPITEVAPNILVYKKVIFFLFCLRQWIWKINITYSHFHRLFLDGTNCRENARRKWWCRGTNG